jgi:transcriptional regulator
MRDQDISLMRGTLELLILKAVSWGPQHGYAIAEWVSTATDATLLIEEGTLYPALHRLEHKGWIDAEWGYSDNNRKAKYYRLSRAGRARLVQGTSAWQQFVAAAGRALAATAPATT